MDASSARMESLRDLVRREAGRFLKQANVTSMGIGLKVKEGQETDRICVQFTVGRKVAPEGLEAIQAVELPRSFLVDGVEVPTDVLQRAFGPAAREIQVKAKLQSAAPRKSAVDPLVPGVSIGHPSISAGTAGCVVYDATTGAPYILSNWHVLNGPRGRIGDAIVQPGSHDDNRTDRNVAGQLVRSHLGVAGDCAVASIDGRRLSPQILDLAVAVTRIGEPDLGDAVIKSGRTTGVTRGIVKRVHVVARIDYGEAGDQNIGCFEIGPDPAHPATGGEISMGGDSGSIWLLTQAGTPTDMAVGLHFAGEVGDEPEHALACYVGSVFEKLGICPQPSSGALVEAVAKGYQPGFVGSEVPTPAAATSDVRDDLLDIGGSSVFGYTHFSLAMSRSRRFARWVAWNIDGGTIRRLSREGIRFRKDPRIPAGAQAGDELYADNPLDRGHIARRADLVWGPLQEAKQANTDSFYFTNITPQHAGFNQSKAGGIWGALEDAVFENVDVEDLRVSVMGGPILSGEDPVYRGVRLPKRFWKVIYYRENGVNTVRARGYVLTQEDLLNPLEALELPEFAVYAVPIPKIAEMAGLVLFEGAAPGAAMPEALHPEATVQPAGIRRIESIRGIMG